MPLAICVARDVPESKTWERGPKRADCGAGLRETAQPKWVLLRRDRASGGNLAPQRGGFRSAHPPPEFVSGHDYFGTLLRQIILLEPVFERLVSPLRGGPLRYHAQ